MAEYDRNRVDLSDTQHAIAKEFNEMLAALIKGSGDKVKESTDALMQVPQFLSMTSDERREALFKVLLANVGDEIQQHFEKGAVEPA